jgi:hypothetical protein
VFFVVRRNSRWLVVHAPHWSAGDRGRYFDLGNGWITTLYLAK